MTVVLVILFLIEAAFLAEIFLLWPSTTLFSSILPTVLVDLANNDRLQNDIPSLAVNPLLEQAAQLKAQDMADKGYFAHTSPQGVDPWFWLKKVGYSYSGAGENLAVNFSDSSDVENAWMNSPSHRENILDNRFTEVGIAAARGLYKGQDVIFVVQFFGRPQAKTMAKLPLIQPAPASPTPSVPTPSLSSPPAPVAPQDMAINNQAQQFATSAHVAGALAPEPQAPAAAQAAFWQKLLSMPKTVANTIYFAIAALVLLALALKIFIKIRIQYPKLIFNGVVMLFFIISLLYLNYLLSAQGQILS